MASMWLGGDWLVGRVAIKEFDMTLACQDSENEVLPGVLPRAIARDAETEARQHSWQKQKHDSIVGRNRSTTA